jgi:hypothetical protein
MDICKTHVYKALELSRELIMAADNGELQCEDDDCLLLSALLRDAGYGIKQAADKLIQDSDVDGLCHVILYKGEYLCANILG